MGSSYIGTIRYGLSVGWDAIRQKLLQSTFDFGAREAKASEGKAEVKSKAKARENDAGVRTVRI